MRSSFTNIKLWNIIFEPIFVFILKFHINFIKSANGVVLKFAILSFLTLNVSWGRSRNLNVLCKVIRQSLGGVLKTSFSNKA